jgi:hypothetical protein
MISAFLSQIKDLLMLIWALQTFFWCRHPVAAAGKTRKELMILERKGGRR